ncbi:MAG: hypothetical protein SVU88_02055 [Candidatus Nanohaloarchaea archaeon]|nr:hypothetical protein [Candidatus Nanohaloarchaea archaeon]
MGSTQSSGDEERLAALDRRFDRLESRMDRLEEMVADVEDEEAAVAEREEAVEDEVDEVRRALNGLRREHRDLSETVEEQVLDYIEEERAVMAELDQKIDSLADLMDAVSTNQERIDELAAAVDGKADADAVDRRLAELQEDIEAGDEALLERVKTLETRMDMMAERME